MIALLVLIAWLIDLTAHVNKLRGEVDHLTRVIHPPANEQLANDALTDLLSDGDSGIRLAAAVQLRTK